MRALLLLCGSFLLLCAGCAVPIELSKDFVTLSRFEDYPDFRAVTGDDARLWVRKFQDPNEADLEFWAQALEHDFDQRGYDVLDKGAIEDGGGEPGRWFQCAANVRGERTGYLVAVWVEEVSWGSGLEVTVVEFAARDEVFEARVDEVTAALRTVAR